MLKITYSLLVAFLFAALLPAAAQAQYGPYKNGASVSGKASIDDKDLDNNTDVTFNFPMIGLAKSVAAPVALTDSTYRVTYTLKVKNYGQLNLVKVQVRDTLTNTFPLPAVYSNVVVTASGTLTASASYTGAATAAALLDESASTLAVGDSATITIAVTLKNKDAYVFNNSATAYAETADATKVFDVSVNGLVGDANGNGNPFDDNSKTPLELSKPDIAVVKSVNTTSPYFGDTVTFKIIVSNNGPGNAANFIVRDVLQSGFRLVSATPFTGTYTASSGEWLIPALSAGGTPDTLTVIAVVNATGIYTNTAKSLLPNDEDPANDESTVTVTPIPAANVSIVKAVSNAAPYTGQQVQFTLTAANAGPGTATNVTVTDTLKQGYTIVTPLPSGVNYNATNHIITWAVGTLTNGQSVNVNIDATVNSGFATEDYINRAVVTRTEHDPVTSNDTSVVVVTPQESVDLVMEKSIATGTPLYAGGEVTFTLKVTNNGPSSATLVEVRDTLRNGYDFVSATPANYDATTGIWSVGTLAKDASATLTIKATVKATGTAYDYGNVATAYSKEFDSDYTNNKDSITAPTVTPQADLAVTKTVDNDKPDVGSKVTFTVTVTNKGASSATGVVVTDVLPGGYEDGVFTAPLGQSYDKNTGKWTIGTLAANATATLTVEATVKASGDYNNKASVTGNENDPDLSNNEAEKTTVPEAVADLAVEKRADNNTPDKGGAITFTIVVTNKGLSTANNIVVTDVLKSGYTFSAATVERGTGTYDENSGIWNAGSLVSGDSAKLKITATVNATGDYSNTVTVKGDEKDPDGNNNTSTITPTPVNITDLKVKKEVSNKTPDAGTDVVFTITVTNKGINDATGVEVQEKLATGYTYKSNTATTGTYDDVAGLWTVGNLANGATAILQITATVNASGNYVNTATVTGNEKDPVTNNNDSTITVTPVPVTDLAVTKSVSNKTPDVGSKVTFTVTVTNKGVSNASGVTVTDKLPDGYDNATSTITVVPAGSSYDKNTGVWTIGALAANATATLTVEATVKASGTYLNTATVTGNEKDPDDKNNTGEETTNPVPVADLAVVKRVSNETPDKGSLVTFTIVVTNKGLSTANNIVVTDMLKNGYAFSNATVERGTGTYDANSGVWNAGSLVANDSAILKVTATVNATGDYSNTVTVKGDEKDPEGGNNTSTVTPTPVDIADLELKKEVNNASPDAGTNVIFTITVANKGINDATLVKVNEKLKDGYSYLSSDASVGTYDAGAGVWDIGNLANGATATLKITARVNASGEYSNTATVTGNEKDPDGNNNTQTIQTTPVAVTDLAVTKEVSTIKPDAGSEVTFTVKVVNNGPSTANNVVVSEPLPTGYTYVRHTANRGVYQNGIWSVGVLDSSRTGELSITARVNAGGDYKNFVKVSGSQKDSNPLNDTASATVDPVPVADMQITKRASSLGFNKDQQITFTLVARNNGPSKATNIEVTDKLQSGFTFVSVQADNGTFDAVAGLWKIASLDSGKEATATMVVIAKATGNHVNTANVTGTEKDNNTGNNESSVTLTLNPDPVATDDAATTEEPTPVTINILDNDKALAGTLAPATVVIKTQPTTGTVKVNADGTVTYTPTDGFEGTVTFTYTVKDSNGNETNVATVTVTVTKRKVDLAITKRIVTAHDQIEVGKNVSFEIVVTNKSTKKASNVEVADILAANLGGNDVVLETKTGTAVYDAATKRVTWTIGGMEGNASATLMVTAKVIAGGAVENTAVVSGSDEESDMTNNTATVTANSGADDLFIPNVITPNGDGKNDKFMILGLAAYPNTAIMIYNRWGNMVYQSSDYKNDWDGTGLNDGTYYFVLTVPKPAGKKVYKGWIQKLN